MANLDNPVLKNIESGQIIEINKSRFTIGRGLASDYVIGSKVVSRIHCSLEKADEGWVLRDSSTNGTMVNEAIYQGEASPLLKNNDEICLGFHSYTYKFLIAEKVSNLQVERLKAEESVATSPQHPSRSSSSPSSRSSFDDHGISDDFLSNLADNIFSQVEQQEASKSHKSLENDEEPKQQNIESILGDNLLGNPPKYSTDSTTNIPVQPSTTTMENSNDKFQIGQFSEATTSASKQNNDYLDQLNKIVDPVQLILHYQDNSSIPTTNVTDKHSTTGIQEFNCEVGIVAPSDSTTLLSKQNNDFVGQFDKIVDPVQLILEKEYDSSTSKLTPNDKKGIIPVSDATTSVANDMMVDPVILEHSQQNKANLVMKSVSNNKNNSSEHTQKVSTGSAIEGKLDDSLNLSQDPAHGVTGENFSSSSLSSSSTITYSLPEQAGNDVPVTSEDVTHAQGSSASSSTLSYSLESVISFDFPLAVHKELKHDIYSTAVPGRSISQNVNIDPQKSTSKTSKAGSSSMDVDQVVGGNDTPTNSVKSVSPRQASLKSGQKEHVMTSPLLPNTSTMDTPTSTYYVSSSVPHTVTPQSTSSTLKTYLNKKHPTSSISITSPSNANKKVKVMTTNATTITVQSLGASTSSTLANTKIKVMTVPPPVATYPVIRLSNAELHRMLSAQKDGNIRSVQMAPTSVGTVRATVSRAPSRFTVIRPSLPSATNNVKPGCVIRPEQIQQVLVLKNKGPKKTIKTGTKSVNNTVTTQSDVIDLTNTQVFSTSTTVSLPGTIGNLASGVSVSSCTTSSVILETPFHKIRMPTMSTNQANTVVSSSGCSIGNMAELFDSQALPVANHEVVNSTTTTGESGSNNLHMEMSRVESHDLQRPSTSRIPENVEEANQKTPTSSSNDSQKPSTSIEPEKVAPIKQPNQGLDQNQFEEMEDELMCAICANLFIQTVTLGCSHSFCQYCIEMWKKKKSDCPICRNKITSSIRTLVLDNIIEKMLENATTEDRKQRQEAVDERKKIEEEKKAAKEKTNNKRGRNNTARRGRGNGRGNDNALEVVAPPAPPPAVAAPPIINLVDFPDSPSTTDGEDSDNSDYDLADYDGDEWYNGRPGAYFGGYGRCYNCGDRGHWANGCPYR